MPLIWTMTLYFRNDLDKVAPTIIPTMFQSLFYFLFEQTVSRILLIITTFIFFESYISSSFWKHFLLTEILGRHCRCCRIRKIFSSFRFTRRNEENEWFSLIIWSGRLLSSTGLNSFSFSLSGQVGHYPQQVSIRSHLAFLSFMHQKLFFFYWRPLILFFLSFIFDSRGFKMLLWKRIFFSVFLSIRWNMKMQLNIVH